MSSRESPRVYHEDRNKPCKRPCPSARRPVILFWMTQQFYAFTGYIAAISLEAFAYARLLKPKFGPVRTPLLHICTAAVVMLLAWPILLESLWRALFVVPLLFLTLVILYRGSVARKLGLFVFVYVLELLADLACWPLLLHAVDTPTMAAVNDYGTSAKSLFIRLCYLVILFFLLTCLILFWTRNESKPQKRKDSLLLPLAAVEILAQIIFMGLITFSAADEVDASLFGVMLPLAFGSFLMLYLFLGRFIRYISGRVDASAAASQRELLLRHREDMEAYSETVRQIRARLNRTVDEMEQALHNGSLETFDFAAGAPDLHGERFTSPCSRSLAVNSLLLAKERQARKAHIRFICTGPLDVAALDEFPMCTVLFNLLDNAIRAAGRCGTDGWIRLCRFEKAGLCGLLCENAAPSGTIRRLSAGDHGLGLSIVRSITNTYGGTMDIRKENGLFAVMLSFPSEEYTFQ